jgi:hypothetical protein
MQLPERPSVEQLKKQAKERAKASGEKLAEAQLALARDYGFASWPKLVHHVERVAHFEQLAAKVQQVYVPGDEEVLRRFSEVMNVWFSPQEQRVRVKRDIEGGIAGRPLTLDDARALVAKTFGFGSWETLVASVDQADHTRPAAPMTLSSSPPFYRIDWQRRRLSLRPPVLASRDWDTIVAVMKEHELTGLEDGGLITDEGLARLTGLEHLTSLTIGSERLTDDGLLQLARMPQLEDLACGGWKTPVTDRGLAVLRSLPKLRRFRMGWAQKITDAGAAHLTFCDALEEVDLMGTNTGDGVINALTGKPKLTHFKSGRLVTDKGLPLLHRFPIFKTWQGVEPELGLMDFGAPSNQLLLDGPFTDAGLRTLAGLEGLYGLNLFWHTDRLTPDGFVVLADLPHLGHFGSRGGLMTDEALAHVAAIPNLRMLLSQDMAAGPAGFEALGRSRTLAYLRGRECKGFESRGFTALAGLPSLRGIGISLAKVDDAALSLLPTIPKLHQLLPIDLLDDGFRHVGQCAGLENLWCMYCRETGDRATEQISDLRLKTYYAGSTRITDKSLEILGRMETLEKAEFWECGGITNAGLTHLARLPHLKEVGLSSPNITREGVAVFPTNVKVDYHSS